MHTPSLRWRKTEASPHARLQRSTRCSWHKSEVYMEHVARGGAAPAGGPQPQGAERRRWGRRRAGRPDPSAACRRPGPRWRCCGSGGSCPPAPLRAGRRTPSGRASCPGARATTPSPCGSRGRLAARGGRCGRYSSTVAAPTPAGAVVSRHDGSREAIVGSVRMTAPCRSHSCIGHRPGTCEHAETKAAPDPMCLASSHHTLGPIPGQGPRG